VEDTFRTFNILTNLNVICASFQNVLVHVVCLIARKLYNNVTSEWFGAPVNFSFGYHFYNDLSVCCNLTPRWKMKAGIPLITVPGSW
jgi:hypothetical protein